MNEKITAQVNAVNKCNRVANEFYAAILPIIQPFLGLKVLKVDNNLTQKARNAIQPVVDKFRGPKVVEIYRNQSEYTLSFNIRASEPSVNDTWEYYEIGVYIAEIRDGVLTKLSHTEERKTNYTVQAVLEAREKVKRAKEVLSEAESSLYPFKEY